jgi:hypothetical protein
MVFDASNAAVGFGQFFDDVRINSLLRIVFRKDNLLGKPFGCL